MLTTNKTILQLILQIKL